MEALDVFSARDLRNRSGGLLKDAKEGRLSLITKHGHPAALAVPFDAQLLELYREILRLAHESATTASDDDEYGT